MPRSRVERAQQRLSAQDLAGARRECAAILSDAAAEPGELAGAHLVLAACCRRGADPAAALAHLHGAVAMTPADPLTRYALAELLEDVGDKQGAIANLQRAVALNPAFVQAWNYLGI